MTLARQPGPERAADPVARLRWALAAALVALFLVLVLLAAAMLALRRTAALAVRQSPAPGRPSASSPALQPAARRSQTAARPRPAAKPGSTAPGPAVVEIAERPRRPAPRPAAAPPTPRADRMDHEARPYLSTPAASEKGVTPPGEKPPPRRVPRPAPTPPSAAGLPGQDARSRETSDVTPEPVERADPDYPADAAAEGVTGTVRLKVVVGARGRVEDALVVRSSGDDRLDRAAEAAVRRWRYRPARQNGRPHTGVDYVEVEFFREADEE